MEKVVFKCYRINTHGKNKGKVNLDSIFLLTLFRNADPKHSNYESVGTTLKRAKDMLPDDMRVTIQTAKETDGERAVRYAKNDLEVVPSTSPAPADRVTAGDETMVKDADVPLSASMVVRPNVQTAAA